MKGIIKTTCPYYLKEMQGWCDGFNEWRDENCPGAALMTLEELIAWHLLPEKQHLDAKDMEAWLNGTGFVYSGEGTDPLACTCVVDGDRANGLSFARTLDFRSLGVMGPTSFLVERGPYFGVSMGYRTVDLVLPGVVGSLTGMNQHGLCAAINLSRGFTDHIEDENGLPAVLYNRMVLETCKTVPDVRNFANRRLPLGPYHLTVCDGKEASSFHFHQGRPAKGNYRGYFERKLNVGKKPLITLNYRYGPWGETCPTKTNSSERRAVLDQFYADATTELGNGLDRRLLPTAAVGLPEVNNIRTMHTVVMDPVKKEMRIAIDNTYASDQQPQFVNVKEWLTKKVG